MISRWWSNWKASRAESRRREAEREDAKRNGACIC